MVCLVTIWKISCVCLLILLLISLCKKLVARTFRDLRCWIRRRMGSMGSRRLLFRRVAKVRKHNLWFFCCLVNQPYISMGLGILKYQLWWSSILLVSKNQYPNLKLIVLSLKDFEDLEVFSDSPPYRYHWARIF